MTDKTLLLDACMQIYSWKMPATTFRGEHVAIEEYVEQHVDKFSTSSN
jgi:hypothetical protein